MTNFFIRLPSNGSELLKRTGEVLVGVRMVWGGKVGLPSPVERRQRPAPIPGNRPMRDAEDCLSPTRGTRPGQRRARKTIATIGTDQHVDRPPARIGRKIATPRRSRGTNGEPQPTLCRTALPG